ncbi:putative lipase [Rubellimicrobium mesophilum DSM 19309]|uniref:Putative lipase n=1 Tax=Rubellimicrobium mesophilum DSM 19309 TaxID=442562 RepID=A0A017HUT6_9RHOB|nr:alpha/beta hydrolase [Rubellimicrobium mesophilum]EYD78272.1 putative lipase [Rubellimicrobium mesophilum DSM 19309]
MKSLLKTTTASAALAAALSVSPIALLAQEAATDDAATAAPATGDAAAQDTMTAQDATGAADTTGDTMTADASMAADAMAAGEVANPPDQPNEQMQAVLDKLQELGAPPIGTVSVEEQRAAPEPADAVMAVMQDQGIEMPAELAAIKTRDVTYPAGDGSQQPARVYTPDGEGPFPLIVYFHGGGWVIADIDSYDASARALSAGADAVVVSVEYRHAPENPFPAAHEDANAAFDYFVENSGDLNADTERLAVAGESAGGNLAFDVAVHARDNQLTPIDHMLLVYPVAGKDMTTPSYTTYADAQPLSKMAMEWFVKNVFTDPSQAADPRIDLVNRDDLQGLPPATIVNAEIDPLQSEGEILAQNLQQAGVEVHQMTYPGVTHEFFGMGAVVPTAKEAEDFAIADLRAAFGAEAAQPATADATTGEVSDVEATAAEAPDAMTGDDAAQAEGTAEPVEEGTATDTGN